MLKLYDPDYSPTVATAIAGKLANGNIYSGKYVEKLEREFRELVGAKYAVGVSSCSLGLEMCFYYGGYRPREVPTVTFYSVACAAYRQSEKLRFTPEIYVGHSYPIGNIWDSAHEVEGRRDWDDIGAAVYSFYPTKVIGGIGGGMVCTNDEKLDKFLRESRMHGTTRRAYEPNYIGVRAGWKAQMTELEAVAALEQIEVLDWKQVKREDIAIRYRKNGIQDWIGSQHIFAVFVKNRDKYRKALEAINCQWGLHFYPIHFHPFWRQATQTDYIEGAKWWAEHELSLPYHSKLELQDIDRISEVLMEAGYERDSVWDEGAHYRGHRKYRQSADAASAGE